MQCVQCWEEVKSDSYRCFVCGEFFCSNECLNKHTIEVNMQDAYNPEDDRVSSWQEYEKELENMPFGRYEWER